MPVPRLFARVQVWYTHVMDDSQPVTELVPIEAKSSAEVAVFKPLTYEEDLFCVALMECGGNPARAYAMVDPEEGRPGLKGRRMLAEPHVQARLKRLMAAAEDASLVSLGSHLIELAHLRDLATAQGNLKVALAAERSRGEVAGLYNKIDLSKTGPTNIQINFVSKHDERI